MQISKTEKKVTVGKLKLTEMLATNGRSKKQAQKAMNDVLSAIIDVLAKGSDLNIIGLGKFKVTHQPLTMAVILKMAKIENCR